MQPRSFRVELRIALIEPMTSSTNSSTSFGQLLASARFARDQTPPCGWTNCPEPRSPGPASGATTRAETGKLLLARCCRNKVDSTDPSVGGESLRRCNPLISSGWHRSENLAGGLEVIRCLRTPEPVGPFPLYCNRQVANG